MATTSTGPVLIVGAGISGLVLAQVLHGAGVPVIVFERDQTFEYRGLGWGLTIHWALPMLRQLLPDHLVQRLASEASVQPAVPGVVSRFPFFDLSSGPEQLFATPTVGSPDRIRVRRDGLRRLLADGVLIEWGKGLSRFESSADAVTAHFDDGSSYTGSLLVACDGGNSRVRKALYPTQEMHQLPIRVMGLKSIYTEEQLAGVQALDPLLWQGAASANDSFLYFSVLQAPSPDSEPPKAPSDTSEAASEENSDEENIDPAAFVAQLCFSWPVRAGFFGEEQPLEFPPDNASRLALIRRFGETWAEPFRSLVRNLQEDAEVKCLELRDWVPLEDMTRPEGERVLLMGDAFHPMVMYRGEGANHAIHDIVDFHSHVLPHLLPKNSDHIHDNTHRRKTLDHALNAYRTAVSVRSRPAVLASRQACLDAHEWARIGPSSPLIRRRIVNPDE